jgi:hypothetical protein
MKPDWEDSYEIPAEIDFSKGKWIKNPFVQDFRELNLVSLDDDVKAAFPDSESVNEALRGLMKSGPGKTAVPEELSKAS